MSVVQLADMLAHLNLTAGLDDALVQDKINAAEAWIMQFTGSVFLTQTLVADFDGFGRHLELPVKPVQSITSITYLDPTLTQQTLATNAYVATPLNSGFDPTYVYPATGTRWPCAARVKGAVTVTLQAGYGSDPTTVPVPFYEAIKLLVAHWYENREAALVGAGTFGELPLGLPEILTPYRTWSF